MTAGGRVIVRVITRLNIGGPARHTILLADRLAAYGWTTRLVTGQIDPHEGDLGDLAAAHGITLDRVASLRNGASPLSDLASCLWLYRFFRRERPAIVHLHLLKARLLGGVAARLAGVPLVVETFHGTLFVGYYRPAISRLLVWVERGLAGLMDAVVAVSDAVAADLQHRRIAPPEKIRVIPLGLELDRFLEATGDGAVRGSLGLPADVPLVGTVGRLVPIKGLRYFVEAAAAIAGRIPGAQFVIVGDGPERAALLKQVERAGLIGQVHFLGWRKDVERIYSDLDVVMLTSLNEGTPVSLIEAMAAGRAVIATRVGGVPDVVQDGVTGVLVPPRDPQALAAATLRLLGDTDARTRLGEDARRAVVARYPAERLAQDMDDFYRTLLAARLAPRSVDV